MSSKVPAGIRAVILDAEGAELGPDSGAIDAYILIRRGPDEPGHILMRGRAAGAGDVNAWGNQGVFPANDESSLNTSSPARASMAERLGVIPMKDKIEARLAELRTEFETGQRMLAES